MKLVANAKSCWKWLSIQIPIVNLAFLATWGTLPAKFQDAIPLPWVIGIAVVLIVLGVAGRLLDQTPPAPKDAP